MNYDIKIIGEEEDNGSIEFDRLQLIAHSTKDIATKALMLRLRGFSEITPDKALKKALAIRLQDIKGNKEEGTSMVINCTNFKETINGLQFDLFKPKEEILQLTPMALVMKSFQAALQVDNIDADVDKPLLKSLLKFKKNFISDNEIFYLANRGTIEEVRLTKDDFQKISLLEDSIPEPKKVIVNGQLDEMKVSKNKLGLETAEGFINVFANDISIIQGIVGFMGKEVTITGIAHYKPNGKLSFVDIQEYAEPNAADKYFSRMPTAITAQQQLFFQAKEGKKSKSLNALINIAGLLKNEISDEEFTEMINDTHR